MQIVTSEQINPVKFLYGTAIMVGMILGLGCSGVQAWSQSPAKSKRAISPLSDSRAAFLNKKDRQGLREIFGRQLSTLKSRAEARRSQARPLPTAYHASRGEATFTACESAFRRLQRDVTLASSSATEPSAGTQCPAPQPTTLAFNQRF